MSLLGLLCPDQSHFPPCHLLYLLFPGQAHSASGPLHGHSCCLEHLLSKSLPGCTFLTLVYSPPKNSCPLPSHCSPHPASIFFVAFSTI